MTAASLLAVTLALAVIWAIDRSVGLRLHPRLLSGLWLLVLLRLLVPAELLSAILPDVVRWPLPVWPAGETAPAVPFAAAVPAGVGWIRILWLGGIVVVAVRWAVETWRARQRLTEMPADDRRRIDDVTARVARLVRVRLPHMATDPLAGAPYVTGLVRPRLVFGGSWQAWPPPVVEHAIGHELLHLRRRDLWVEALWMTAAAIYWFHPLVHVARRRAHEARELSCDADAAVLLGPPYRTTLRQMIGEHGLGRPIFASGRHAWGPAVTRLKAIDRWQRPVSRRARLAVAVVLFGAAAALGALRPGVPALASVVPTIEELVDPVSRQERGLGSLHLRYALVGRAVTEPAPAEASPSQ
ncbi:MAG TPA: M56 family metallopeptidase [Vicinamibacterales bacterium]|nr:M56 family metallopeptidase [Vicinamibacterales bacterium]